MDLQNFNTLETQKFPELKSVSYLAEDAGKLLFLDSPALEVFSDYRLKAPLATTTDTKVTDAKKKMILANRDLILVVNSDNEITGILDLHYAESVELQRLAQESGTTVAEMTIDEAMMPISKVRMISYDMLEDAKIGHIVNTLMAEKRHQVLVYSTDDNGKDYISGYFALSYIRRKLNLELSPSHQKDGVASISKSIK